MGTEAHHAASVMIRLLMRRLYHTCSPLKEIGVWRTQKTLKEALRGEVFAARHGTRILATCDPLMVRLCLREKFMVARKPVRSSIIQTGPNAPTLGKLISRFCVECGPYDYGRLDRVEPLTWVGGCAHRFER